MRDFNQVCSELRKNLLLCGEANGTVYWYKGTLDLVFELLSFANAKAVFLKEGETIETEGSD